MSYNKYPKEMKETIIARMLEGDETVTDIQRDTGVGINTLYRWRDQAKHQKAYQQQQNIRMQINGAAALLVLQKKQMRFGEWTKRTTMLETLYALGITPSKRGIRKSERKTSGKMGKRNQSLEFFRRRMAKSKTRSRNKKEAKVS